MSGDVRRVVHVIDGLGTGGAERSLMELVVAARTAGWASTVVCLHRRDQGVQSSALASGTDVRFVKARSLVGRVRALRRAIDDVDPDLVHSTLYRATLVSRLACRGGRAPVLTSLVNTPYAETRIDKGRTTVSWKAVIPVERWREACIR